MKYFWLTLLAVAAIAGLLFVLNAPLWVFRIYFYACLLALAAFGTWVMKGRVTTKDKDRDVYM